MTLSKILSMLILITSVAKANQFCTVDSVNLVKSFQQILPEGNYHGKTKYNETCTVEITTNFECSGSETFFPYNMANYSVRLTYTDVRGNSYNANGTNLVKTITKQRFDYSSATAVFDGYTQNPDAGESGTTAYSSIHIIDGNQVTVLDIDDQPETCVIADAHVGSKQ